MSPGSAASRILVVEDDPAIREALNEVLVDLGYEVVSASDGRCGLVLAAEQTAPCPILLDWRMPVLDGPEFLARLRELPRGKEFPVILSTADRSATGAEVGDQVAGVLSKPFDLDSLLAVLKRVSPRSRG
ncbi:MAG TPA: response regulator [Myxococcaceae bacterium]|nr:response regulator [Myxococcaceae bacterium]